MRKSLFLGSLAAIALVVFDLNLFLAPPLRISLNYAVAQELPYFAATTTLSVAPAEAWEAQVEMTNHGEVSSTREVAAPRAETPVRVSIPSIQLDTSVIPVGLNAKGEMDVPDGRTANVGWYKAGPKPGQMGSAVLDAHVFAAFENLRYAKIGDDIIVETESGQRLRFVVEQSTVYKLSEITSQMLFGRTGDRWLNLITCAGSPVGDTYTHRLVVYARFEETL